ncbi:MAG: 30S ribosomal protein S16 [Candidatus Saccharimonadales bacterium]
MLVIRLQRTGRSGHAMFRIIVQDSRRSPKSGSIVAYLGNYDPHTKTTTLDKDSALKYLNNGAQPSARVIRILKSQSVKLPKWVSQSPTKKKAVKKPEKRRSTAPKSEETPKDTAPNEPTTKEESSADNGSKVDNEPNESDQVSNPQQETTQTESLVSEDQKEPKEDKESIEPQKANS